MSSTENKACRKKPGACTEQGDARLPPLAINGYSLHLPGDITTGEQLFELVAAKRQMRRDAVAGGRYPASMVAPPSGEGSNPWLLNTGLANLFTDEEVESYDYHLFRVTQKMARYMDIRQIGVLQSVWRALEDAGIPAEQLYRTRTGVFVAAYVQVKPAVEAPDETMLRGSLMSSLSDHVAFFLGTHGPSLTLETACSSSLVALAVAASSLRKGECDTAIVAAANIPQEKDFHLSLQACGVLSVTGTSHPFDEAGPKGYVRAEGFGAIVLRRLDESVAAGDRVLCTLRNAVAGAAGAAEGVTSGPGRMYESPCAYGMVQLMSRAYEEAGLDPAAVDYMECHATGTQVGDRIELEAVGRVMGLPRGDGAPPLRVASVKSNIGHAETAAGLFSLAKAIEMLRRRVYLPSAGVTAPRSDFEWGSNNMRVIQDAEPFGDDARPRLIGINSFGIGGSYGHTIVEEYRQQQPPALAPPKARGDGVLLFPLSAASPAHLKQHARQLAAHARTLDGAGGSALDICGTMAAHRSQLQHRKALVVSGGLPDLAQQLEELASGPDVAAPESAPSRRILFVFTGQGAQWQGVGETLMDLPPYRDAVIEVDRLFHQQSGWSILEKARSLPAASLIETQYAQPLTLMVQVGLMRLLGSFGISPHIVVGHSAGEVASAWAAGLLTLEEAVAVAVCRSGEQQKLAGCGRLLAVGLGQEELLGFLSDKGLDDDIEVACINSPQSTVLAGSQEALDAVKAALPEQTFSAFVPGNIAFHSSRMEPILPEVRRRLAFLDTPSRGERPAGAPAFVSTVTGEEQVSAGADYWANNILSPVAFERAVATIFADEETAPDLVIEIGPHKTLADPLLQTTRALGLEPVVLPTLRRNGDCRAVLTQLLAGLFDRGLNLAPAPFFRSLGYRRLDDLPAHPFLKTRMHELAHIHRYEAASGMYLAGPVAGSFKAGAHEVEVCDRTFKTLTDHKMGGVELLPGAFYLEMAIEATAKETGFPVVLSNLEFKTMCRIPHSSAGEPAALLTLAVQGEGPARAFAVRSTPARARPDEPSSYTEHCTGFVLSGDAAASVAATGPDCPDRALQPGAFGLLAPFELRDVGPSGLAALKSRHAVPLASSREQFYGLVNKEGLSEYGPTFQVVTSLHANPVDDTYLGTIDFDSDAWAARGGCFGVPLLDSVLQMLFLLPSHDPQIVTYAGGFEAAYMLRVPTTRRLWALVDHDGKALYMGRRKKGGDIYVYDEEGRLVFAFKGVFCIYGASTDTTRLCDLVWQPRVATAADNVLVKELAAAGPQVERLAPLVARAAHAFHQSAATVGGPRPTVFRVLEILDDGGTPTLAEALSRLELDPNRIIEVYVGSHSTEVLSRAATNIDQAGEGLRVRKVLMPALPRELADYTFDVITLHGWDKSGRAPWDQEKGAGGAAQAAAAALGSFLTPGALLLALGTEGSEADEWTAALQTKASHVAAGPGAVAARFEPPLLAEPRSYLVVAEDATAGSRFAEQLIATAGLQCAAKVLTTGPNAAADLPDGAPASDWATALSATLQGPAGAAFRGIVFMGSLDDDSLLGTKGFGRLAKLCQAATTCEADITAALGNGGADGHLWVLTEGTFGGEPRPNQGTIQGLASVMCHELGSLETRLIDLAVDASGTTRSSALAAAAGVVAASPREKVYRVSAAGVEVPRYMPIDIKARITRLVSPGDPDVAYCCDVTGDLSNPGRISVEFAARPLGPPSEGEVVVDLQAAALNFRDVMIAINMLPELSFQGSYYGRHLGMEASGVVSAVGPGVKNLRVGDRVATAEPYCFGNRLIAPSDRTFKLPDCISFEVAASVQSVYNTAHHALVNVGRIKAGDTVLIHAAAGGVGHAAISVCRHLGATVYATASAAKRDAVRAMGVAHVYDSRSTSWFDDLMRDTAGRGVDAVLNSLAGQHQRLGVQALAPGGRFLEIGKMDIYDNAKLGIMALRKNGVFAALDMDRLAADDPALTAATTSEVFRLLAAGVYHPLPVTSFPMDRIKEAIELVKTGGHVGKVVLTNYTPDGKPVPVRVLAPPAIFRPDATYLITGAAGGFGSKLVRAAFEDGARHFVITVTRDPARAEALFGDIIATPGASLEVLVADTASEGSVEKVVRCAASGEGRPPLRTIFHVAGISTDTLLTEVTPDDLLKVAGCKALGAYYLHKHTEHIPLDTFCVISSVASFLGGRGRAAYSAANAYCDALIRLRRAHGLPGAAFNMTSLSDVGILAQDVAVRQIQMRSNVEFVRSVRALQDLEATLACGLVQGCELFFRETAVGVYPNRSNYFHGGRAVFTLGASAGRAARGAVGAQEVQALILEAVEAVLGHGDVSGSSALFSIGLDSFSSVELLSRIKEMFGVDVPPSKMGPATTVADLTRLVTGAQAGAGGDAAGGAAGPSAPAEAAKPAGMKAAAKAKPPAVAPEKKVVVSAAQPSVASVLTGVSKPDKTPQEQQQLKQGQKQIQQEQQRNHKVKSLKPLPQQQKPKRTSPMAAIRSLLNKRYGTGTEGERLSVPVGLLGLDRLRVTRPMVDDAEARRWLQVPTPRPGARSRLLCLPWAGGTTQVFGWLAEALGPLGVEVVIVVPPGRDSRAAEPPLVDVQLVAEAVAKAAARTGYLRPGAPPLSLLGASYGSYVVLDLARILKQQYSYSVDQLYVSSACPPVIKRWIVQYSFGSSWIVHNLLGRLGGLPEEYKAFQSTAANRRATRATRLDLGAMDFYSFPRGRVLDCPVHVIFGDQDWLTPPRLAIAWSRMSTASTSVKLLRGHGHLYLLEKGARPEVEAYLRATLLGGRLGGRA